METNDFRNLLNNIGQTVEAKVGNFAILLWKLLKRRSL